MAWAAPLTVRCGVMVCSPSGMGFFAFAMMRLLRLVFGTITRPCRHTHLASFHGRGVGSFSQPSQCGDARRPHSAALLLPFCQLRLVNTIHGWDSHDEPADRGGPAS